MRSLFVLLLVLLGAVALVGLAWQDPGYVMIQFHGWTAETSLVFTIVSLFLGFAVLYLLIRLFIGARRLSPRFLDWVHRRGERSALAALTRGFLDLAEGRWRRAEKRLTGCAEHGGVLAYLGAARAAHEQGADQRRDEYLRRAAEAMPKAEAALALAQAEMHAGHGQHREARAVLDRLRAMRPRHPRVLLQLCRLCAEQRDWETLLAALPVAKRREALDQVQADRLERRAWQGVIGDPAADRAALEALWWRMPAALKSDAELIRFYAERLSQSGAADRAEEVLIDALHRGPTPALLALYGTLEGGDPSRRLRRAEDWLTVDAEDVHLLLALGRLSRRASLWGKARHYLEACVRLGGPREALTELALVLETTGESSEALKYYRRAAMAGRSESRPIKGAGLNQLVR